jgi:hypothetical protein
VPGSHDVWPREPLGVSKALRRAWWGEALGTETTIRSCRSLMLCPTLHLRRRGGTVPRAPPPHIAWKHAATAARAKRASPRMRGAIGRAGSSITRCRCWRRGVWRGTRLGGKKWTPALTFPQMRQGIAMIVREAFPCGTLSHLVAERQKRLRRNELARFYPWKRHNLLAPLNLYIRRF